MDWLKELIGEELYNQIVGKLGEIKLLKDDGSVVPKTQLDEGNEKLKNLNAKLETLQGKLKEQEGVSLKLIEKEKEVLKVKKEGILTLALSKAKARDENLVKTLLKDEEIEFQEDGTLKGLNEQLEDLKQSHAYLFEEENIETGGVGNFSRKEPKVKASNLNEAVAQHYKDIQK